jgi:hypothetical protein
MHQQLGADTDQNLQGGFFIKALTPFFMRGS